MMPRAGRVRVGIGGWTYEPWRETFYPADVKRASELEYASRQVTVIEINGTYYRAQKPSSFAKWRDATPDDFVFSVKASRYATNRKVLADAGESIERFIQSGLAELGDKLGPIVWQFATTKRFDAADFPRFLELLPRDIGGRPLRHALDVRHASFMTPEFIALARRYRAAIVFTDSRDYPSFADLSADFVYARLMRSTASVKTGYQRKAIVQWSQHAQTWAQGDEPGDLPRVSGSDEDASRGTTKDPSPAPRDVFVLFINGAKERAPAAARELLKQLGA
jgi:uncharacterized protein YecE (DUF72 family)